IFTLLPNVVSEIAAPPDISDSQKKEFALWKKYYLNDINHQSYGTKTKTVFVNQLIFSQSPYLKQHAFNPINWKPWSDALLKKAKLENKLIFLSIGYSSCHWCHVMNEESFKSIEIAKLINQNYLAIKIDREELPHIDNYYMNALQAVTNSGGWPITAIINGNGGIVYIDSYLSKNKLMKLLSNIATLWQKQPEHLLSMINNIASMLAIGSSTQRMATSAHDNPRKVATELLKDINTKLILELDNKHGGFISTAKFPSEPMLLYALDQLINSHDMELGKLIKLQLDNMISGELYDHIGGGFHRYSSEPNWTFPHFEKTLYNQAQLVLVYSKAFQYFHDEKYLEAVRSTTEFLVNDLYLPDQGFMSAIDADYLGSEGAYYSVDKTELMNLSIPNNLYSTYKITGLTRVGVVFKHSTTPKEKIIIENARKKLLSARRKRVSPNYDTKIITGWNGLTIKALITAGQLLNHPVYIELAEQVADNLWDDRFDTISGILRRNSYTTLNETIYLSDYAYLADSFISLYDIQDKTDWLAKANILIKNAINKFSDDNGDIVNNSDQTTIYSSKDSSDDLISPYSIILSVKDKLIQRLSNDAFNTTDNDILNKLIGRISIQPIRHLSDAKTLSDIIYGDTEFIQYFANSNGKVQFRCIELSKTSCQRMEIDIRLENNWHINSQAPLQDHLIATKITDANNININYPKSTLLNLGFQKEPISVFSGQIRITLEKTGNILQKTYLKLPLQACNDRLCLLPETLRFSM
ncbi:MAG: DUF255 domain-containing protein, partial [Kangiellaceae bacterium]|nr:DUF255 domain-containing protein [Kangiellaceae bacterium]